VQKVRKAKTDAEPLPEDASGARRPAGSEAIWSASMPRSPTKVRPAILSRFAGQGFGAFKPALADILVETLRPIGTRLAALNADPAELDRLLGIGATRANEVAAPTLAKAYEAMGL
jgi:tryptophanyl-tRNA synthetase